MLWLAGLVATPERAPSPLPEPSEDPDEQEAEVRPQVLSSLPVPGGRTQVPDDEASPALLVQD